MLNGNRKERKKKKIQTNTCAFPISFALLSEAPSFLIKHNLEDKEWRHEEGKKTHLFVNTLIGKETLNRKFTHVPTPIY